MIRRCAWVGVLAVLAGCADPAPPPLSDACTQRPETIVAALHAAPGPVRLSDGTALSRCVHVATEAADLQNLGSTFTAAGASLADQAPRRPVAALRLGYLVGAVERGAKNSGGFQDELVNRMRSYIDNPDIAGRSRAAMARGHRAGRVRG